MALKAKHRRLVWLLAGVACFGAGAALVLDAFQENLVFFRSPSEVAALHPGHSERIRLGGLVVDGSIARDASNELRFAVTDLSKTVTVAYRGEVPALFREGQGVIAEGTMNADGLFRAEKLLAKHDENYMPPEVARSLKQAGHPDRPVP